VPSDPDEDLELPRDVLRRLDRFSRRVDRVGFEEMFLFAASPSDPDAHDDARFAAESAAFVHGRTEALEKARERGHDWVARFLSAFQPRPVGTWSPTVRFADDRSALQDSVADAIAAIITWDLLSEEDRDELLGPWARLAI
jgi:hypothetical protein